MRRKRCPVCNTRHDFKKGLCATIITGHGYYEGKELKITEKGKKNYLIELEKINAKKEPDKK